MPFPIITNKILPLYVSCYNINTLSEKNTHTNPRIPSGNPQKSVPNTNINIKIYNNYNTALSIHQRKNKQKPKSKKQEEKKGEKQGYRQKIDIERTSVL